MDKQDNKISFRIDSETLAKLDEIASQTRSTRSGTIKDIIDNYVANNGESPASADIDVLELMDKSLDELDEMLAKVDKILKLVDKIAELETKAKSIKKNKKQIEQFVEEAEEKLVAQTK